MSKDFSFPSRHTLTIYMYSSIPPLVFVTVWSIQTNTEGLCTRQDDCSGITLLHALVSYSIHLTSIRLASQTNPSANCFQYHTMKAIHAGLVGSSL